jgi:hypothetical protein
MTIEEIDPKSRFWKSNKLKLFKSNKKESMQQLTNFEEQLMEHLSET